MIKSDQITSLIWILSITSRPPRLDWSYWCSRRCGCSRSKRNHRFSRTAGCTRNQWSLYDCHCCCCDMQHRLWPYVMHCTSNSMRCWSNLNFLLRHNWYGSSNMHPGGCHLLCACMSVRLSHHAERYWVTLIPHNQYRYRYQCQSQSQSMISNIKYQISIITSNTANIIILITCTLPLG